LGIAVLIGLGQLAFGGETATGDSKARPNRPQNPAQIYKLQLRPSFVEIQRTHKKMQERKHALDEDRAFNPTERRRQAREQMETVRTSATVARREFRDSYENARADCAEQARKLAEENRNASRRRAD
jgi:hypothetical protein